MIHSIKNTAISVLVLWGAVQLKADQTNLVQNLSIRLGGIATGPTETNGNIVTTSLKSVQVSTKDVIQQLGTATANSFSDKATLVVVTPLPSGNSAIVIRDGSTSVDVSVFFVYEQKSDFVSSSHANLKNSHSTSKDYSIQRLALTDSSPNPALTLHFDVQGIGVETTVTAATGSHTELDAGVAGSGDENGKPLILEGSFRVYGHLLEVVPTGPPVGV